MQELIIDPEFRDKIPPLTDAEFNQLEENIVADGEIREPIITWNDVIIDGHHRWKIHQKHPEIPYKTKPMEFADKWAAIVWMCRNQMGRRNMTDVQLSKLLQEEYDAQKMTGSFHGNQFTGDGPKDPDHMWNASTAFYPLQCPESGAYTAYKKAQGLIVELEIPADALRSSSTSRKCRASKAKVISITDVDGNPAVEQVESDYDKFFIYVVGQTIEVKNFDINRWNECAPGIHHFITRDEAVKYQ